MQKNHSLGRYSESPLESIHAKIRLFQLTRHFNCGHHKSLKIRTLFLLADTLLLLLPKS